MSKPTIALVTIARDEHDFIREWIDVHRRLGVSTFYIYDNGAQNDEPLATVLADDSRCHVIPFPGEHVQLLAYTHFIDTVMPLAPEDWFAMIDCDEFICPVKHETIPDFLEDYGHLGSIGLQWRLFSANGHVEPPRTMSVIGNYTSSTVNPHIKTLAHKSHLSTPVTCVHNVSKTCRDLDGQLIDGPHYSGDMTETIRLNHYFSKSWSDFLRKIDRGRADVPQKRNLIDHIDDICAFDAVPDRILVDKLGIDVHDGSRDELASVRSFLGITHPALPAIEQAFRDNPRHEVFAAKAAGTYQIIEGSVNDEQVAFITEFVRTHRITNVLEIGFNGGMSASAFLGARQSLRLVSVDIATWPTVLQAKDLICKFYPGRHTLHIGDSTTVVPLLPRDEVFDLAFVDGGHTYPVPLRDLENVLPLLKDHGWIIMDDYCPTYGSEGVISAWDDMVARGLVHQVAIYTDGDRGWAVGYKC